MFPPPARAASRFACLDDRMGVPFRSGTPPRGPPLPHDSPHLNSPHLSGLLIMITSPCCCPLAPPPHPPTHTHPPTHNAAPPAQSVKIQRQLGADLIVVLDECTPFNVDKEVR